MASRAEEYFKQIKNSASPAEFLKGLLTSKPPRFEDEWLEFKGNPHNDRDGINAWSKSLSAFANTEGGVLIWGIDARKKDNTDSASGLRLITNTSEFKSRLLELLIGATDPPVSGVQIEEIVEPPGSKQGFVVCLIPESEYKPVRAELEMKQYYIDLTMPRKSSIRRS